MTDYQTGRQVSVAYKAQPTKGTPPGQTGSSYFRVNSGGLSMAKQLIQSGENRRDGMMTRGRHGQRSVNGSFPFDLALGAFDDFFAGAFRSDFAIALALDETTTGSATALASVGTHTITASSGSWITKGLRVGDIIRATSGLDSADLNKNLTITALTATVITVQETLSPVSGPIATWDITRSKKLIQGISKKRFYVEERDLDIGASVGFDWCTVGRLQIQMQPNGMGIGTVDLVGTNAAVYDSTTSPVYPYFTGSPAITTSLGMTALDAAILVDGSPVLDLTGLTLDINLNAAGTGVIASDISPDVFTNLANMQGCQITALRPDMARFKKFLAETQVSLHVKFVENESEPKDFCSFFIPNLTYGGATPSPIGQDGPRTETIPLIVGVDDRGGAYDATMVKYQTSAA